MKNHSRQCLLGNHGPFLFIQQYILGITNGLRANPKKTLRMTRPLEARLMRGRLLRVRQKSQRQKLRIPSIKVGMKSKSSFVGTQNKRSLVCLSFVPFLSKLIFVRRVLNVVNATEVIRLCAKLSTFK